MEWINGPLAWTAGPFSWNWENKEGHSRPERVFQRPGEMAWSWYQYNRIITCLPVSLKSCSPLFPLFFAQPQEKSIPFPALLCIFSLSEHPAEVAKHCSLPPLLQKGFLDVSALTKAPAPEIHITPHTKRGTEGGLMQRLFQGCYI